MSLQSEVTMTSSDEETLEDVVLELMRGTGFLGTIKGQIAKFINETSKIDSQRFVS
jgi:hypothetical protein